MGKDVLQMLLLKDISCHFANVLKGYGRPKRTWIEIRKYMDKLELRVDMAYDKMKWKERKCNPDLNSLGLGG